MEDGKQLRNLSMEKGMGTKERFVSMEEGTEKLKTKAIMTRQSEYPRSKMMPTNISFERKTDT